MKDGQYEYVDVVKGMDKTTDRDQDLAVWFGVNHKEIFGVLRREHDARVLAERRILGEAPLPIEKCQSRAVGGPCVLPAGHNIGQPDVPQNHRTGPAHRNKRAHEIGVELSQIAVAIEHLLLAYGDLNRRSDAWTSDVFTELSNRRQALRTELVEMG